MHHKAKLFVAVGMINCDQFITDSDRDSEFLVKLTCKEKNFMSVIQKM